MKDLFGNVSEAAKPDDADEPFAFTDAERAAVCAKISEFADLILGMGDREGCEDYIKDIVDDIERVIASDVVQH